MTDLWRSFVGALGGLDLIVFGCAIAALFVIAWLTGRKSASTRAYFLGERRIPWPVACLAFVATEISAVTILSVPADGFGKNWFYLQFFIGSAAAKVFVAFVFVPLFFRREYTTIYEYLGVRFGRETQCAGAAFFFITRLLGSGVRLCMASGGVAWIMGWHFVPTLIGFTIVSVAFIGIGGIKAVMWAGAFSTTVFYLAGGTVIAYLLNHITGGVGQAWQVAHEAGKLRVINLQFSLSDSKTLWVAAASTFFTNVAVFGADQDFVQRLLTVKTRRASQLAVFGSIGAALPLVVTYLTVGTLLFVFYKLGGVAAPVKSDHILPDFTRQFLPDGLKGLVLAAVVLASIDSPLNSLSASFVTDIYRPLIRKAASERHYLWVSRGCVVAFGVILCAIAWAFSLATENLLWIAIQILVVLGGPILGVFLLGLLTKVKVNRGNVAAMVIATVHVGIIYLLSVRGLYPIAWTWLIVVGTAETFGFGYLLSFMGRGRPLFGAEDADAGR